ncbi:hydroxymethylglutaryl-CoA synthase [Staphylococcus aureus]
MYTGSLYLSLISLLQNHTFQPEEKVCLFSYGSGAVGEIFSGSIVKGYDKALDKEKHLKTPDLRAIISRRIRNIL